MKAIIEKSTARGRILAPPSKSYGHRALIAAGLAEGKSCIQGVLDSEDISATLDCVRLLGAEVEPQGSQCMINGTGFHALLEKAEKRERIPGNLGDADASKAAAAEELFSPLLVPCRESGSTLRFFLPVFLLLDRPVEFQGYGRLMERPMGIYEEICQRQGLFFQKSEAGIKVRGSLKAGDFQVPGNISSQFITGLLFALPLLPEDSRIQLIEPVESRSYIRMTIQALNAFGIEIKEEGNLLSIRGNQRYQAGTYTVEGDYSNAAFLDGLGLLGGQVQVDGLAENSLQGDKIYRTYFRMLKEGKGPIDLQDCPDLGPVLMAMAAAFGGGHFIGTSRLKIKESDRGTVMAEELAKFGIAVSCKENEIIVKKGELHAPKEILQGHNDHRIVMSLSVLATRTGGVIEEAECVKKSYPGFFEDLKKLGIGVTIQ